MDEDFLQLKGPHSTGPGINMVGMDEFAGASVILLIWRSLTTWDVLDEADLLHELEGLIDDGVALRAALAIGADTQIFKESVHGWHICADPMDKPMQALRQGTAVTAGIYAQGPLIHARLPEGAAFCVSNLLKRCAGATTTAIHQTLVDSRWVDIPAVELLLHLAYHTDYDADGGRWHMSSGDRRPGPRLGHIPYPPRQPPLGEPDPHRPAAHQSSAVVMGINLAALGVGRTSTSSRGKGRGGSLSKVDRRVWITRRGEAYHTDSDCRLLRMGWAKTYDSGKRPTGLSRVTVGQAVREGRHACPGCT